jgi:hypothetical protein
MRRPRRQRLGACGALALVAACASPAVARARGTNGASDLAAALNATAEKLAVVAAQPPFPSSLYQSFSAAAVRYPVFQPLADATAAPPPRPPLLSTVDPTALIYLGPPVAGEGSKMAAGDAAAPEAGLGFSVTDGTTTSTDAPL